MTDTPTHHRTPPTDPLLHAAARAQPGGWVYEIDFPYPPDQPTPPEAIRGAWESSPAGELTGNYSPNPRYRPIQQLTKTHKPFMLAGARANPAQWIVEIDPRGEALFPDIPRHHIVGWWYVDPTGILTASFRPNSFYLP